MRAENIRVAAKALEELKDLEFKINTIEKYFSQNESKKLVVDEPYSFEFNNRFYIKLTPSVFIADLKRQAEKLRFTIKSLGVEEL